MTDNIMEIYIMYFINNILKQKNVCEQYRSSSCICFLYNVLPLHCTSQAVMYTRNFIKNKTFPA